MSNPFRTPDRDLMIREQAERINAMASDADVTLLNLGPLARMDYHASVKRLYMTLSDVSVANGGEPIVMPGPDAFADIDATLEKLVVDVAEVEDAVEGGGTPEWLPEGAVAHLDFGEGNYYADGAEQLPATLIDGFEAGHITAGVYSPPAGSADLLAGLLSSVTGAGGFSIAFEGRSNNNSVIIGIADIGGEEIYIYTEDFSGVIVEEGVDFETAQSDVEYTTNDPLTFAATISPDKIAVSDRGGTTVATVIDPETQWFEWTDATFNANIGYRVVTIYAPLADAALPALSAP